MASPKVKVSDAIDLIDVILTTDSETHSDNDAISLAIEIPNAVASAGGSAIIQSITLFNLDNSIESPAMELVFIEDNTDFAGDEGDALNVTDTNLLKALGSVTISNYSTFTPSTNEMASKQNIGMVVKAPAGSTSIYVMAINRSGGDYTPSGTNALRARIGIVKD
jgi:hypothetical protein|tara:strand:- start:503 stop:997 length:495 start_codon:yes stop_codon:yes gene_type:complete